MFHSNKSKIIIHSSFILFTFVLLISNFNIVNAETVKIPEWVFLVYDFWIEEKITDDEFTTMLLYLENSNIIELILHKDYDAKTNFLLSIMVNENTEQYTSCSSEWHVTGYFTPVESDYFGEFIMVNVNDDSKEVKQDFVDAVKIEGWGKTLSGDYLGWYDDLFHTSDVALDQNGYPLEVGQIAVDNTLISRGDKLLISTLPEPWNQIVLVPSDEGPSIQGKHIDLFTGEGKLAENETFRVTSENNQVCR